MTSKELLNLDRSIVSAMTAKELRAAVTQLSSEANKRWRGLASTELGKLSPAYEKFKGKQYDTGKGGIFGVKGKTYNQLQTEFTQLKEFLGMKTSTSRGWRSLQTKTANRLGVRLKDVIADTEGWKKFWKAYRTLEESQPIGLESYGSAAFQKYLHQELTGKAPGKKRWNSALQKAEEVLKQKYEEVEMGETEDDNEELESDNIFPGGNF